MKKLFSERIHVKKVHSVELIFSCYFLKFQATCDILSTNFGIARNRVTVWLLILELYFKNKGEE